MAKSCELLLFFLMAFISPFNCDEVQSSKLFILPIEPSLFNWTVTEPSNQFWFRASLINSPDLPKWMNYIYSQRHRNGFLFGVPPQYSDDIKLELVGLNKDTYETRTKILHMNIIEKTEPAKFELRLKIDNLNLEDMFDANCTNRLLKIFTKILWPESSQDLHFTFMDSAVKLGARLPLHPNDGDGVVLHLGSVSQFSDTLVNLQEEVKPLWKLTSCPRDFKRSSVDRHFRPNDFLIDWCSFRLIKLEEKLTDKAQYHEPASSSAQDGWDLIQKENLPRRNLLKEMITTFILPAVSFLVLMLLLSFIFCIHHENIADPTSSRFFNSVFVICEEYLRPKNGVENDLTIMQYEAVQRATSNLRTGGVCAKTSPRTTVERIDTCRPSPPPYAATRRFDS